MARLSGLRSPYVETAFAGELARLRGAPESTRNRTLNSAAYALGRFVGGGLLETDRVTNALTEAALDIGLSADETKKTIASGLDSGMKKPKTIPARTNGAGTKHGKGQAKAHGRIVETYNYVDETGDILFQVCRLEPKDFRQRKPNGADGWDWSVKGVRLVPYRLPEVLAANRVVGDGEIGDTGLAGQRDLSAQHAVRGQDRDQGASV